MSSTARATESTSSSNCWTTETATIETSSATTASPVGRASPAAARSRWRRPRNHEATGDSAGAIVSATAIGSAITRTYQTSARRDGQRGRTDEHPATSRPPPGPRLVAHRRHLHRSRSPRWLDAAQWRPRSATSRRTARTPFPRAQYRGCEPAPSAAPARSDSPPGGLHERCSERERRARRARPRSGPREREQDGRQGSGFDRGHSRHAVRSTWRGPSASPRRIRSPTTSDHTCAAQKTSIDPSSDKVIVRAPAPDS